MKAFLLSVLLQVVARLTHPALIARLKEIVLEVATRPGLTGAQRRALALELLDVIGDEATVVAREMAGRYVNLALEAVVVWAGAQARPT